MKIKHKKLIMILAVIVVMTAFCSVTAFASGDVANAVEGTWNSAKGQVKTIVDKVVFPVIDVILAVLLFVKISTSYMDYRKHGQFEWTGPAVLFGCLIFSLTAPLYIWSIVGLIHCAAVFWGKELFVSFSRIKV